MLRFYICRKRERQPLDHAGGPIEFGRGPKRNGTPRFVIQDDLYVSKDHVRVEELPGGQVRVENLSSRNPIWLSDESTLQPGLKRELFPPARLTVGETVIEIERSNEPLISRESLETIARPFRPRSEPEYGRSLLALGSTPTAEVLTNWFETVIAVQRAAAGSKEFYDQTAQALVEMVGLDRGLVLLLRDGQWEVAARQSRQEPKGPEYSQTILRFVVEERRTFYQAAATVTAVESLHGVEAVVASPVFDAKEQVVGVVYGSRMTVAGNKGLGVGPLEAQVVQLLASAVGAGLARLEHETEAGRLKVQFEQFFSANLARELQRNPDLLDGQERLVTVFFCDIRGFSGIAEKLGPRETCKLVAEVMDCVTARIREHDGVIVDFMGDGLLAMWNAPADQADHAERACRAALAAQADMPAVSAEWEKITGKRLALGVGINTGPAMVGNIGSKFKFKYGPLGHTVNLGSRVEGATKHLRVPILVTGSTRSLLGDAFATRRICRARLVNLREGVDLYELHSENPSPEWLTRRDVYEKALALYEAGRWGECCGTIYPVLAGQVGHYDVPALDLVARSCQYLKKPPVPFDPVLDFDQK